MVLRALASILWSVDRLASALSDVFMPIVWVLPHRGTNGQVSSWGAHLAGAAPPAAPIVTSIGPAEPLAVL